MKACFSFCIYGTDPKYYFGLQENVRLIDEFFPDFDIVVYRGKTRRDDLLVPSRVHWIDTDQDGVMNMVHRYRPVLDAEYDVVFVRDVDSEIHERDRWCIHDFLTKEEYGVQVIRDHFYHKSRLTGGLTAFHKTRLPGHVLASVQEALTQILTAVAEADMVYGSDENQLNTHVWPRVRDYVLVYSNICVYAGEASTRIDCQSDTFCGNVVLYDDERKRTNQFSYLDFPVLKQWQWMLQQQNPPEVCRRFQNGLPKGPSPCEIVQNGLPKGLWTVRFLQDCRSVIDEAVLEQMVGATIQQFESSVILFAEFATRTVTPTIKALALACLEHARMQGGYRVVGTCNVDYLPTEDKEVVVYFGNFPDDYLCLPQKRAQGGVVMYSHVLFFKDFKMLDAFVGVHPCWDAIACIYIMGLEKEHERMTDVWNQLCAMHAPLDRVREYRAAKDPTLEDIYIGVTKNHIDCLNHMKTAEEADPVREACLFLEDDFVFTSRTRDNQRALQEFFARHYDFELCFLSSSKYHRREPVDDLLIQSKQICTTSSGYLVHRRYIDKVHAVVVEGYNKLLEHRSQSHLYCIDRYWATKLDKIFIFKDKLGFQKPSQSKITGNMNLMLD